VKMAYYKKVIQPGENVKYVGELHWMIYKEAIILSFFIVFAGIVGTATLDQTGELPLIFPISLVLSVLPFMPPWLRRATTEIVVTDKRIIRKVGWIARRTEEMNMTKVETVDVRQGVVGRMLGFGTVLIIGVGSSWEPLVCVTSPVELRNAIMVG
jgi:uncharacterized membrane protein YdbT with pleckstrin-like domain